MILGLILALTLQLVTPTTIVAVQTSPHTECQLCGQFTNMTVQQAEAQLAHLAAKQRAGLTLTTAEIRLQTALWAALSALPTRQLLNDCGDTAQRCETQRGVRLPLARQ